MSGFYIDDDLEWKRLDGLRLEIRMAYLFLRSWVDYATFEVGRVQGRYISWKRLAEWMETDPHQGIQRVTYSDQQARRWVDPLIEKGLVVARSNVPQGILIFYLPVAHRIFLSKKNPTGSRQGQPTGSAHSEKPAKSDRGGKGKADRHQLGFVKPTTTRAAPVDESHEGLIVPGSWTPEEKSQCTKIVSGIPLVNAQAIVDEVHGAQEKGAIQKSKAALCRGLLREFNAGRFVPTLGIPIAQRRAHAPQAQRTTAPTTPDTGRSSGAAQRAAIRSTLNGGKHA